jgi:DnaK suppressor protein
VKKYEQIHEELIRKRDELESRLNKIDQDVLHTSKPPDPDSEEQATERENDEVLDALGGLARSELEKINTALERIKQNEYGICVSCKKPIPIERLKAIPHTGHCVACAE